MKKMSTFRIEKDTIELIKAIAFMESSTQSSIIEKCINEYAFNLSEQKKKRLYEALELIWQDKELGKLTDYIKVK